MNSIIYLFIAAGIIIALIYWLYITIKKDYLEQEQKAK
jgi:hypothetical protein